LSLAAVASHYLKMCTYIGTAMEFH
jgi:hypothetical protein